MNEESIWDSIIIDSWEIVLFYLPGLTQEPEETADFEIINSEPNAESIQKLLPGGDQSHQ